MKHFEMLSKFKRLLQEETQLELASSFDQDVVEFNDIIDLSHIMEKYDLESDVDIVYVDADFKRTMLYLNFLNEDKWLKLFIEDEIEQ